MFSLTEGHCILQGRPPETAASKQGASWEPSCSESHSHSLCLNIVPLTLLLNGQAHDKPGNKTIMKITLWKTIQSCCRCRAWQTSMGLPTIRKVIRQVSRNKNNRVWPEKHIGVLSSEFHSQEKGVMQLHEEGQFWKVLEIQVVSWSRAAAAKVPHVIFGSLRDIEIFGEVKPRSSSSFTESNKPQI